jgi:hypothetical protein
MAPFPPGHTHDVTPGGRRLPPHLVNGRHDVTLGEVTEAPKITKIWGSDPILLQTQPQRIFKQDCRDLG